MRWSGRRVPHALVKACPGDPGALLVVEGLQQRDGALARVHQELALADELH
jgi:hypothetical protein